MQFRHLSIRSRNRWGWNLQSPTRGQARRTTLSLEINPPRNRQLKDQGSQGYLVNFIKGIQKDIDDLDAERAEEKEEFEASVRDHNEATEIITQARRLFEGAASIFLQTKGAKAQLDTQKLNLVGKTLHEGAHKAHKFSHRKSYGSLFKILATITTKAHLLTQTGDVERY